MLERFGRLWWTCIASWKIDCSGILIALGKVWVVSSKVKAGSHLVLYPGVYFWGGEISLGHNVAIGKDTIIYAHEGGGVTIGNNVAIAAQCYIIDSDHGIQSGMLIAEQPMESRKIIIEDDVLVSAGCKILKGVTLHEGCVIGAGAVVNKDIPSNAIAVGVPAKIIGYRKES